MAKNPEKSADKRENSEPEASNMPASDPPPPAVDSTLPMVESPQLDGSETIEPAVSEPVIAAASSAPGEAAAETATPAAPPRSWRFALLAATIALAAALGSFIGSLTASGIGEVMSTSAPAPSISTADASSVLKAFKAQLAELTAMKLALDSATRNANTQLTAIADAVDRLNKLNTGTPETTGSIVPGAAAAAPTEPKITDRILEDWIVQDVHGDRALVESRNGGIFDVGAGSVLPGIGRVESVKRQDGQWIVVTARGLIMSAH
jgi:hypothetical protein